MEFPLNTDWNSASILGGVKLSVFVKTKALDLFIFLMGSLNFPHGSNL